MIYFSKMHLFAGQLGYSQDMIDKLHSMAQFISLLYVPAWLSAPLAADAPQNDLRLYQTLLQYRVIDRKVADAALGKMRRHMNYLRPEIISLSLASNTVSDSDKAAIASSLLANTTSDEDDDPVLSVDEDTRLSDLVDGNSWQVFRLLKVDASCWLSQPVSAWEKEDQYVSYCHFVRNVRVTNDVAERGVAMVEEFIDQVKDEQQLQWLVQAVEDHRKRVVGFDKRAMASL